jgi:hypothetical protein
MQAFSKVGNPPNAGTQPHGLRRNEGMLVAALLQHDNDSSKTFSCTNCVLAKCNRHD